MVANMEYSTIDEKERAEVTDSDEELEEAFLKGELKPGLIDKRAVVPQKKEFANNVKGLKSKLSAFKTDLPWIERLEITTEPAFMAPELNVEIQEHADKREKVMRHQTKYFHIENDPIHNDFKREITFYRQAQAAVLEGYRKLKELNLPTMRPEDYFAQMAKSDEQMQKIRSRLLKKQKGLEISERVKKIRDIKKYGKKVQIEAEQRKVKEKKEMIDKLNKYRKGKIDNLDFLNIDAKGRGPSKKGKGKKVPFGKNKYTKRNTADDIDGIPSKRNKGSAHKHLPRSGKNKLNKRPGKAQRQKSKSRISKSRRK
ncbi:putative rRNA-processing protein EBP2 [Halocaridina rubra]|uniref:rRNA-processing protein EBP2 n=1 Tax=Halocaridina rubra TaxID=373956 RepID=A0AAN8WPB1_HALRR